MIARLRAECPWRTWVEVAPDQWVERKVLVGMRRLGPGAPTDELVPTVHRQGKSNGSLVFRGRSARYALVTYPRSELDVKKPSRARK